MENRIRTIVVDDEPLARRGICVLLDEEPDFVVTDEFASGPEAVEHIRTDPPDLVLLDIQMPEMDGFEVVEQIGVDRMPVTVFITAYDEFALRAFDTRAVDYVLKPVDADRFTETLHRVKSTIRARNVAGLRTRVDSLLEEVRSRDDSAARSPGDRFKQRLVVRDGGRVFFLPVSELVWVESAGNYVKLHTAGSSHLIRDTMTRIEQRLEPDRFIRIRRSAIVNIDRIKDLQPIHDGRYLFRLTDGTRLESSRRYRSNLERLLSPRDK